MAGKDKTIAKRLSSFSFLNLPKDSKKVDVRSFILSQSKHTTTSPHNDPSSSLPSRPIRRRFWKDVLVKEVPEGHQIHLDTRPVRTPSSKTPLVIPRHKPHLATAIALEWDLLTTAQQASKQHFIPLTSLVGRAEQIREADTHSTNNKLRREIVDMVMRYLDTDTLLCWSPEPTSTPQQEPTMGGREPTLRELQIETAVPIITYLTTHVWPGVEIHPVADGEGSIIPAAQPDTTKHVIRGWIAALPAYELAGLERAVLAGKGLLGAIRLVVEWSEHLAELRPDGQEKRFGVEEAATAASLEVAWQTRMWGEVEDTHDVEKEDLRRQLGSVVLLVAGEGEEAEAQLSDVGSGWRRVKERSVEEELKRQQSWR
ncbi:MAG: ATP synthase complex assembly protein atp12 [Peltula sp. TS41687]|nr:MAG: ATP synthase complex assembly protein atp12 [Peltula sp. TS41687]